MQPRELCIQLLHIRRRLYAKVSEAHTAVIGKADVRIVGILTLFFFQLKSQSQEPMEQVRRSKK